MSEQSMDEIARLMELNCWHIDNDTLTPCGDCDHCDAAKMLRSLTAERDELQALFDMRWNAQMRAIKKWNGAHPDQEFVSPGHEDLCLWLMEQRFRSLAEGRMKFRHIRKLEAEVSRLSAEVERLRMANEAYVSSRDHVYEALDATARQEVERLRTLNTEQASLLRRQDKRVAYFEAEVSRLSAEVGRLQSVTVGAIPETTDYANGWNDCRKEYRAALAPYDSDAARRDLKQMGIGE